MLKLNSDLMLELNRDVKKILRKAYHFIVEFMDLT